MLSGDAGELELLEADTRNHRRKRCTCSVVISRPLSSGHRHASEAACAAGMGTAMLVMSIGLGMPQFASASGAIALVGTLTYVIFFALGAGPVPGILVPEITPAKLRGPCAADCLSHMLRTCARADIVVLQPCCQVHQGLLGTTCGARARSCLQAASDPVWACALPCWCAPSH